MKKLGARLYQMISFAVSVEGTFDPKQIFYLFEEKLTDSEFKEINAFLTWVHVNGKAFGSGNYEQVFKEFKASI